MHVTLAQLSQQSTYACASVCVLMQVESSIQALLARQQHLQEQRERLSRTVTVNTRAPKADWQGSFAWDQEAEHLLHESFGLQDFRSVSFLMPACSLKKGMYCCSALFA